MASFVEKIYNLIAYRLFGRKLEREVGFQPNMYLPRIFLSPLGDGHTALKESSIKFCTSRLFAAEIRSSELGFGESFEL
ncbi:hypothetical protein ACFX1R_004680 [Malus domestica]